MKRVLCGILLCVLLCLAAGCKQEKPIPLRMVEWVYVDGANLQGEDGRCFYLPESLEKILMAIRLSGQTSKPAQDPETLDSRQFCITTVHADGSRHKIFVKGDRYLKSENGPWRQVDPDKLAPLHYLLHFQSGDAVS